MNKKYEIIYKKKSVIYSEDALIYALYENYISQESEVFFKFTHNLEIKNQRGWDYWCVPDIDVIEVKKDKTTIAYELKGARKYKKNEINWPGFYDGIGQAMAYLELPKLAINYEYKNCGGAFDFIYLVHAMPDEKFMKDGKRIFDLLPLGFIIALPDGSFIKAKDASKNPLCDSKMKLHFLKNLQSLKKYSINSRVFERINQRGSEYFSRWQIVTD
ncbi:MAG: hypothetical protein ABII25_05945 [bacterium]